MESRLHKYAVWFVRSRKVCEQRNDVLIQIVTLKTVITADETTKVSTRNGQAWNGQYRVEEYHCLYPDGVPEEYSRLPEETGVIHGIWTPGVQGKMLTNSQERHYKSAEIVLVNVDSVNQPMFH